MRSIEEIKNGKWKENKDVPVMDTGSAWNASVKLFEQYKAAAKVQREETKRLMSMPTYWGTTGAEHRKTNTAKTYSQALTESREKAKALELGAKLPEVIPPKGDVSKLILPDTGGGGTVNPTPKRNEFRTNYDYMTDKEAAVYKYYRDRGQIEKAQAYLDALEMEVNQRAAVQNKAEAKMLAEESAVAALFARAAMNVGQTAGALYSAAMAGTGRTVDPYHPLMGGVNINEGLYEGLMGESTGVEKFAKEAGLAVFDWGTQAAMLGPATPYVMAAGAAAGNTKDALERGGSTDEAVLYGLTGGAAEAITEKLGYDRWLKYGADAIAKKIGAKKIFEIGGKATNKKEIAGFLKSIFPQAGSEAAEEATSEIANILADTLIMGDNSQMKQIAQTAMESGATESEAVKTALQQGFLQVIYSGAIGAASGGVIAGGVGGLSRARGRNILEMTGNPAGMARDAAADAKAEIRGENKKGETGEKQNAEEVQDEIIRDAQAENVGNMPQEQQAEGQTWEPKKAVQDFGEKYYYTEGQKVVNEEAERRGDTSFIPAFQTYYTAGLTGVKESDIKQTAETTVADRGLLSAAYLAGVNDRKADLEARMKGVGKMGQTAGVFLETEAVTPEQRSLAELVSRVAELEVVLVDELPQDRRGYYENNKGRVTIALNSGQFAGTLFHEATHYLREANPEGYDRMQQAVFSAAAARKGMDTDAYIRKYEKRYGEAYRSVGQEVNYNVILEEMTADAFAEIAGDEKSLRAFVTEMQRENPSVLEKIKEFLENLLETLRGLVDDGRFSSFGAEIRKDIKATERMAKMLAEEMKTAGEKQREESNGKGKDVKSEKKFSKKIGGVFPEINVTIEDFKQMGISEKSLNNLKVIEEKVCQYLSGKFLSEGNHAKPITNLDTGMEVCVYRGGINETFRKDAYYKNLSSEWKKIKLAAMMHMDMLIKYGEIREKEAANYHKQNSTTRFAYLTAPILVGGKPYTVDIDIKRTDRGDRFHVHKIKIADSSAQAARMRPVFEVELSAGQIITQDKWKDNQNRENQGTEKRFSFAGERARTADKDKLKQAKKMEEEGKTRREIYDETGWFRGADDKWRFEIDDSQMQYRYAGTRGISAYLQHSELFAAYPELRDVNIKFEKLEDGLKGLYNRKENEITLDESLKEAPGTVLLHEIQHAIQRIEGHASGANSKYWERRIEEGFDARTAEEKAREWNLTKQMEELQRKNPEFYQEMQELDSMVPTVPRGEIDWETLEQIEPDPIEWQLYDQRREQIEEKYGEEMFWDYIDLKYRLDQSRKESGRTAFDLYYATAGEIEARDAEKRMNFTKEDRKRWFPNIGDEDTVFAEGVRFSIKEDTEGRKLSEEQKRFFAESKAVDSQGRLLTLYHQTGNDFTIFEPRRKGAGSSDSETPFGIFMKTSPDDIGLKGKKQMELYANIKNPLEVTDRGDLKEKLKKLSSKYVAVTEEEEKTNNEYKQKFEEAKQNLEAYMSEWRKEHPEASRRDIFEDAEYMKRREMESKALSEWENANAEVENKAKEIITEILEENGYDGVILKADRGSFGRKTDAYIALHPEQVKRIDNLNPTNDADIRFSIREEAYDALVEENEALKEANEALRRQFEITKDAVHDPVSAKEAVRKWLKAINSTYDVDIFTEKFLALANYVANAGDKVDFQKVMGALQKLAYDALSESKVLNTDLSDAYKDFKDDVRKTKIKVTEDMAEEFDYYGGYNTVRKENFGKINLSRQGGIFADVFYQEMAEKYPELLDVERVSTQVDVVMDLLDVVDSLQPIYENPYGMNLDEYAMDAAYDLWEMYFDIEMQKPTFADKYEKKVEQLQIENQKLKAAKNKMRQEMKERHEEQMEKAKAEANKKLEEEREKYIRQVDVLLEEKYKLRQKLETQWKAHKNSMVEAQRTELARLIAEGKKTASEIRELKKDKEELKQRMDEVLEREDLWVQACQAILRENNKEINRYKKQVQRLKESKEKQRESAIRKYDRLLEEKFQREERRRKQREKNKYGKYKKIIDKERNTMEKWKTRGTDEKHIQEWMLPYINVFIEKMNFDDPEKNFMPTDIQEMQVSYNKLNEEVGLVFEEEEETIKSLFADLTKTIGNGIQIAEFDAEDIRKLSVIFRSMTHMVRNGNRMVSIRTGERISDISNAYMKDMENKKTKKPDSRLRVLSDMMNVQMLDTESFFKEMGKTVHDTIYRGLREGFDRKIKHIKESVEFMQNTVDKKKIREWGEMEPQEYSVSSGKILLTDAQIMSLYCLNRREQAKGHIYQGGIKGEPVTQKVKGEKGKREIVRNTKPVIVTQEDVKRIIDKLTEEQKKVALAIQEFLEKAGMWGNEVTLEMFGYKKFNETNYFPIVTDENYIKTVYGARAVQNSTMQNAGTTKQTQKNANNPIILENIFDVFVRHTDFMSSYNAFVPALSDLNKFMNYREIVKKDYDLLFGENRSVKETMQRVMGPAGQRYIRELTERLNNPAVKEDVERLPRIFLRNMKIASVGANLRVIIQQPVSYLRAADEIGVEYLMGALAPSKTDFEKVYAYAPIAQWKEWGNYEMNVGRTMKELLIGQNFYERFLEKSMIAASAMDKLTWGRIWRAAELEVKKKHPELTGNRYYETVGKRFSEIIDGTQVVDSILHRNQMMRSTSLYSQMFTSFMSEPTKTYNMMRNSMVAVIKDNTPENRKKLVRTFMTLVANGVCVAAAAGLVDMLRDDDDDETLLEKWLQAFRGDFSEAESVSDYILAAIGSNLGNSFNPLGYIPYMRDIFSVLQGYKVERTDISWLNDLVKSGKNLMRYMSGESNYTLNAVLMDAAGSLSKATGIPINSAKRDILAIKNTIVNYTLGLDAQYENQKLTYNVGSEKNISMYVKMMLEAKMSGNEQIATRIYNDMVNGGISNEKIDNKIKTEQVKAIKEEPEAMEAAKAYNEGRVDDYIRNVEALAKKGYFMANIESAVESLTKPPEEDEETFETITKGYWKEEGEVESADYTLLFNAYMNGNMADYDKMWAILNAAGKEDNSIRSSMRSRLKSEYWKAKEAGDSQRMQRAAEEFYRLGGKRETLEKAPQ